MLSSKQQIWHKSQGTVGADHWIFIDVNALVLNPKNHKWDAKCRCLILNSHFSMLFKLPTWRLFSWLLGLSLCLFWVGAYQPCDNSEILFITPLNLPIAYSVQCFMAPVVLHLWYCLSVQSQLHSSAISWRLHVFIALAIAFYFRTWDYHVCNLLALDCSKLWPVGAEQVLLS